MKRTREYQEIWDRIEVISSSIEDLRSEIARSTSMNNMDLVEMELDELEAELNYWLENVQSLRDALDESPRD